MKSFDLKGPAGAGTTQKGEHPRNWGDRVQGRWETGSILILISFFAVALAAFGQSHGPTGADQVLSAVYDARTNALRTEGGGTGGGTVTSVGLSMPSEFGVSGSPVTSSGTLSVNWAQPTSIAHGGTGQTTAAAAFNVLAPSTSAGGLIYGTGPNTYGNLSLGASGQCLQSSGTALIWGSCGTGNGFTAAGDLAGSATSQTVIGLQGRPVSSSAPTTGQTLEWNGTVWIPTTLSGVGTVSSVGLSLPASLFSVSGSPVTTSGTLTGALANQSANLVFAGPSTGAAAAPSFRALVPADIPALNYQAPLSTFSAPANEFLTGFTSPNTFTAAQPNFSNLSGTATLAQLPSSLAQFTGTITAGDCAKWSSSGVLADAGAVCGSGSGITLQTNGTNNSSQTLLNLTAGSGISLSNTSGGIVSIAATGGGALPSYWINNSTTGSLSILPNGDDATPLIVGPAAGVNNPGMDVADFYTNHLPTPSNFTGPTIAAGGSIPVGDVVTACVTYVSPTGETPCSPSQTSAATTTGSQEVTFSQAFVTGATGWKIYAAACASPGPCTGLTYQITSTSFSSNPILPTFTSIATGGAAPPTSNTALAGLAFGVAANGTLNMPLTYNWTLGANNQPDASFVRMYGGVNASAYDQFFSPALEPPAAPSYSLSTTGGSIGTSPSAVTVAYTYVNGPSSNFANGQGNYPETTPGQGSVISLSGCTGGTCEILLSPPTQGYAGAFNVYIYNGTNWILENSAPITSFSANVAVTSIPSSPVNAGPTTNNTSGQFMTAISAAAGANGLACVSGSVPGSDCAAGTFIATNPMTAAGDLIYGGAPNAEGVAVPTRLGIGSVGQCLDVATATTLGWTSCGSGGSSAWSSLTAAAADLTLDNATYNTTFNQTSAAAWTWANTTAATSSANQNSPVLGLNGTYWTGSASATDGWTFQDSVGTGSNPNVALNIFHSGGSGIAYVSLFGNARGFVSFANCGTGACSAIAEADNGGAVRFSVSGGGAVSAYSLTATNGGVQAQTNFTAASSGSHIDTSNSANDIAGTITISSATSGSKTFAAAYSSAPSCTVTLMESTAGTIPAAGAYAEYVTTSALRIDVTTSGTYTFSYHCVGIPN